MMFFRTKINVKNETSLEFSVSTQEKKNLCLNPVLGDSVRDTALAFRSLVSLITHLPNLAHPEFTFSVLTSHKQMRIMSR